MKRFVRSGVKVMAVITVILIVMSVFSGCAVKGKVIGIAWRADTDSEFYTNIVEAVRKAGSEPVLFFKNKKQIF